MQGTRKADVDILPLITSLHYGTPHKCTAAPFPWLKGKQYRNGVGASAREPEFEEVQAAFHAQLEVHTQSESWSQQHNNQAPTRACYEVWED
jgi:hypothetical protein